MLILLLAISVTSLSQVASATYNLGDIPTDTLFHTTDDTSFCPGYLTVTIPVGATILSVDVEYDMTALGGGFKSEQRSELWCTSPGGLQEDSVYLGLGVSGGTQSYNRTGLEIANGVTGGGDIDFELHAGRTFGSGFNRCGFAFNKVDDGTWTVTVHYCSSDGYWLGNSTAWDDTANWCGNTVPDLNTKVIIPASPEGGFFPVITGSLAAVCDTIIIESGAVVTIENNSSLTSH